MASIADVAREANVSVATVSRVINGKGQVRSDTQKRVHVAIEKLSYEPNLLARNFRKDESRVILILAPNITNPYYSHILSGIGDMAHDQGYSAFICNTNGSQQREQEILNMLHRRRADGAILLASEPGNIWLKQLADKFPIVQCSEFDPQIDIAHVSVDNYKASQEAVQHLIDQGHTRIATVSSVNRYHSTTLRLQAYRDTLQNAGIPIKEDYIFFATKDYSFKSGVDAIKTLLMLEPRPTALFCISDTLALGCITGAKEMGFQVPRDVAVIGFDDVENTTMFHPYITSVAQPCYEIGRKGAEMLFRLMRQEPMQREVILDHKLVVRESSAKLCDKRDFMACL